MRPEVAAQIARVRAMPPDEKVGVSHTLWLEAREAAAAGVRMRDPDWDEAQVAAEVRLLSRHADD